MTCCIIGCRTGYKPTRKHPNPTKHSSFYFPKDFELRGKWITAVSLHSVKRENWAPKPQSRVCARHFLSSDFRIDKINIEEETIKTIDGMRSRLLPHAIPSINLTPEEGNEPQLPTVKKRKAVDESSCSTTSLPLTRKTYEREPCHQILQLQQSHLQTTTPFHVNENVGMHVDDCAEETQLSIVTDVLTSNTEECNVIHQGNSRHSDHQPNNKSTFERSVVADYPEMISSLPTSIDDLGIFIPADNWTELNQGLANRPSHNTHLVEAMFVGEVHSIRKSVTVDFLHSTVTTYMLGKLCDPTNSGTENPQKFSNYAEANYILREFAARGRCVGISVAKFQNVSHENTELYIVEPDYENDVCRATRCHLLSANGSATCTECQSLLRFLTMRKARDQKMRKATNKTKYACKTKEQVVQELRLASNKIKMLMQWKQRAKARLQVMKKDVVNLRAKMSEIAKSTTYQNIQDKMKTKMDSKITLL